MPAAPPTPIEHIQTTIFNVVAALGVFLTAFVLAPAFFSSSVKRSRIWFGLLTSYLIYSAIYLLLAGRQFDAEPPFGLCFFQAVLVYGIVPVCGVSTACFAIDFVLELSILKLRGNPTSRKTANLLVRVPWALGVLMVVVSTLSVDTASKVRPDPNHFYCHITNLYLPLINIVIILLCGLFINVLEIYIAILLYRNWAVFKQISRNRPQIAFSTFIRLSLFSSIVTIAIVLSIFIATNHLKDTGPAWSIVLATLPIFTALCFGTQKDILCAWMFWRRRGQVPPAPLTTASDMVMIIEHPRAPLDV